MYQKKDVPLFLLFFGHTSFPSLTKKKEGEIALPHRGDVCSSYYLSPQSAKYKSVGKLTAL